MKIKKEFIPLILTKEKKLEFRIHNINETKQGIYKIGERYFVLKEIWNLGYQFIEGFEIKSEEEFFYQLRILTSKISDLDPLSETFMRRNNYYEKVLQGQILFIYQWQEWELKELIGV